MEKGSEKIEAEVSSSAASKRKASGKVDLITVKKFKKETSHSVVKSSMPTVDDAPDGNIPPAQTYSRRNRQRKPTPLHVIHSRKGSGRGGNDKAEYFIEDGFRKVRPYFYNFNTFCKGRWIGKTLLELYSKEFRYFPIEHYERMRKNGNLLVNLKPVQSLNVILKQNDMITSKVHRHEGAVTAQEIGIVADDRNVLVVNKPSSIPIHAGGCYRHNTLCFILRNDYGFENLRICHRLDRLTSGLVIFGKNKHTANKIIEEIRKREVEKEYVCRVVGEFPTTSESQGIVCSEPVTIFDHKLGCCAAWEVEGCQSKEAFTKFHRLSTDGETSIVLCKPRTGRMHQIRVHLQYLGYPIANDPMYNHEAWGEERFKYGPCSKNVHDISLAISQTYNSDQFDYDESKISENKKEPGANVEQSSMTSEISTDRTSDDTEISVPEKCESPIVSASSVETSVTSTQENTAETPPKKYYSPDCPMCQNPPPNPRLEWMVMDLHAYRYKGSDWNFETPLPDWAQPKAEGSEVKSDCITNVLNTEH